MVTSRHSILYTNYDRIMRLPCSVAFALAAAAPRRGESFVAGPMSLRTATAGSGIRTAHSGNMRMSVDDGYAAAFSRVEQALEMSPLDHAEAMGLETWTVGGNSGTIAGYKGRKVDWVSSCSFKEEDGRTHQCLRAWVMPMFDVPHLSISLGKGPNGLTAELDLVAKDDLMYMKAYREKYYAGKTSEWWEELVGNENVTPVSAPIDLKARTLASPVHVSLTMPDTDDNAAVLGKAVDDLVTLWLDFLDDATEIARVRRGTMLGRDSELRRVWWAVTGKDKALGDRGPEIAAAMAGPGDMGYTGQAS